MAVIGISILIASLSFLFYKTQFTTWWPRCRSYLGQPATAMKHDVPEKHERRKEEPSGDRIKASEKEASSPRLDLSTPDESDAHIEDAEEEEEDPTTPTASNPFILPPRQPSAATMAASHRETNLTATESSISAPSAKPSPSSLMPPPPRPKQTPLPPQRTPPSISSTIRAPSSGPIPNRGPPSSLISPPSRPSNSSLMPPPSMASSLRKPPSLPSRNLSTPATASTLPTQRRKKITLSPGHSPIDWASLVRSNSFTLTGLPKGITHLRISPSQLALHNGRKGAPAWSAWQGKVYNLGAYLPFHPGGEGELLRCAGRSGKEVEKMFMEVHPWVNWEGMLGACCVGMLVGEGEGNELVVDGKGLKGDETAEQSKEMVVVESELDEMD